MFGLLQELFDTKKEPAEETMIKNEANERLLKSGQKLVGAIDQGTSSTRFLVFTEMGEIAASAQMEHTQIFPPGEARSGWHEHDPLEIFANTKACIEAVGRLLERHRAPKMSAVGITNQRETTVAWNRETGKPYYNAIVWDDTRTTDIAQSIANGNVNRLRRDTGLPLASYFAGTKVHWLLKNVDELKKDLRDNPEDVCFGTIDTWLVYQLTGTPSLHHGAMNCRGKFMTDVTNASRWLFMNIHTLEWDEALIQSVCAPHHLPVSTLPTIRPSSHVYATCHKACGIRVLDRVPIGSILGDQHAALFGQTAFSAGEAKNTYGTGLFLMMNTGTKLIPSNYGLLTTVAFQQEGQPVHYALEGSVSHSGSTLQWLRDQLQIIRSAPETERLATKHNDGLYFVPSFSGLFAPYWDASARACIVGLTASHNKGHLCRAALEATCYQTKDVFDAIESDSNVKLKNLKVDGGGTANKVLMQFQADMLGVTVVKPKILETTSIGAAFAAGLATGVWRSADEIKELWGVDEKFDPKIEVAERERLYAGWKKAISKSQGWINATGPTGGLERLRMVCDRSSVRLIAIGWLGLLAGFLVGRKTSK